MSSFAFGQNQEPLDLSKGGDSGSSTPLAKPAPLNTPGAGTTLPQPPVRQPAAPAQITRPSLPEPPKRVTPVQPAAPVRQTLPQPAARPAAAPVEQQRTSAEPEWEPSYEQQAPAPQAPQQYTQQEQYQAYPEQNTAGFNPAPSQQQQYVQQPVQQVMVDRKGRPIKQKPAKASKPTKGKSSFSGDRRKVLWARIAVFGILGILVVSGIGSFVPKASGLRPGDGPLIIQNVRENLGITDFPATSGEGIALGFSKTYLTYDPNTREDRYAELLQYAPEGVIQNIDPRVATQAELEAANATPTTSEEEGEESGTEEENTGTETDPIDPETGEPLPEDGTTTEETTTTEEEDTATPVTPGKGVQTVTDGPYLVRSVMVQGGENAIFTTKTQINGKSWVYMEIPMLYDTETGSISVAGSPTFVKPIEAGQVPTDQYSTGWANDVTVVDAIQDDMTNYMRAWGAGDAATLERFTVKKDGKNVASESAISGLDGSMKFIKVNELAVETKPAITDESTADEKEGFYTREARISVSWLEPESGLVYNQTYALTLQYVNDDWFVSDIQNIATTEGQYKDKL